MFWRSWLGMVLGAWLALASTPALARKQHDAEQPKAALLIGAVGVSMDNRGRPLGKREPMFQMEIKNLDTRKRYKVDLGTDGYDLLAVEPGTYCINYFRLYANLRFEMCRRGQERLTRFRAWPGMLTNAGYFVFGIEFTTDRGQNYRLFEAWAYQDELAMRALQTYDAGDFERVGLPVAPFPPVTSVVNTSWLEVRVGRRWEHWQFLPGGELVLYGSPFGDGTARGTWSQEGDVIQASLGRGSLNYHGRLVGDRIEGTSESSYGAQTLWILSRDLLRKPVFTIDATPRLIEWFKPEYPAAAARAGIEGRVRVAYKLAAPADPVAGMQYAAAPTELRVVASEPPGVFDAAALKAMQNYVYALGQRDGLPVPAEGEQIIEFNSRTTRPERSQTQ